MLALRAVQVHMAARFARLAAPPIAALGIGNARLASLRDGRFGEPARVQPKKNLISMAAFSALSEPCTLFSPMSFAYA